MTRAVPPAGPLNEPQSSLPADTPPSAAVLDLAPPEGPALAHGIVLLPPAPAWDGRRYTGPRVQDVDATALRGLPGVLQVVRQASFVAVIAARPELAQQAAARLRIRWSAPQTAPSESQDTPDTQASTAAVAAQTSADTSLHARYRWPLTQPDRHATWAVAWRDAHGLSVWSAANPIRLRAELAQLLDVPAASLRLLPNGQPTDAAALDTAASAALLAQHVSRPVRMDGSGLRPADALATIDMQAEFDAQGLPARLTMQPDGAATPRPSLARLLAHEAPRTEAPPAPPYRAATTVFGAAHPGLSPAAGAQPALRAAHVFAQESFIDEAARAHGTDPADYRLRQLDDARGSALIRAVAERAGWQPRVPRDGNDDTAGPRSPASSGMRAGRGFAYASVLDDSLDPPVRSWSAWVADVIVDTADGSVALTRVVAGHDLDRLQAVPAPADRIADVVREQASRLLDAPAGADDWSVPGEAAATALAVPEINVVGPNGALAATQPLHWSEAAGLPAAAAVANAIYDATGVRLREPPFNGPAARLALQAIPRGKRRRAAKAVAWAGGLAAAAAGLVATAWPWKSAIAPIDPPDLTVYSAAAIERGRRVAAAGDCVACHTAPGGRPNAGGLALDTPFGTVYTTNITPDPQTGIGNWSYPAFERAMRHGIHRDGRQLYPAFPYTAFAKLTDADMQALYAYLMTQEPVAYRPPETKLAFPYNARPLLAGWNALFHDARPYQPDPGQTLQWNRGAYLVQGIGHCGACHTPRNALGAERDGAAFLAGGEAEGWHAPALNALSRAPVPWSEQDLYAYLRTGFSERHGVAAGPMAPVVHGLAHLPDSDVRAIAVYLASINGTATPAMSRDEPTPSTPAPPATAAPAPAAEDPAARIAELEAASAPDARLFPANGERLFQGACAACHETRDAPALFGARPPLALNTNLHAERPDNLIQVILHGIPDPANGALGYMPGFRDSLDDGQVAELAEYLRARYAPQQPAWKDVAKRSRELRQAAAAHEERQEQALQETTQ